MKRRLAVPFAIAAAIAAICLSLAPASAQSFHTWVSRTGDDANSCSPTAPCGSFAGAIAKTRNHGEIDCLDSGDFGSVTIQKSVTIDCQGASGGMIVNNFDPMTINFDGFDPSDTPPSVTLRHLNIIGVGVIGSTAIQIEGAGAGSFVNIENCFVTQQNGFGIQDQRTRGLLIVDNTTVQNIANFGISIQSASGSRRAVIRNTRVINSGQGIVVGANSEVVISHSEISDNANNGLFVTASTGSVTVDSTTIAHNNTAFRNSGTVRLSNSDVSYNAFGWIGTINTFTNNRFTANGVGGPLFPIGSAVNPTGEQ
jgi:parallel beta helix pectate lyase-like protein